MKFTKAMITAAAIFALALPAMAGNSPVMKENNNLTGVGYLNLVDNNSGGRQLLARGGAGRGGGNGAGKGSGHKNGTGNGGNGSANGPGDGTGQRGGGYGPGDGTGNGGSGPRDGSGNGPKTGDCDQTT